MSIVRVVVIGFLVTISANSQAPRLMTDWSKVKNIRLGTAMKVVLFPSQGSVRKIRGRFDSCTDESLIIASDSGMITSVGKNSIRKGLIRRPIRKRIACARLTGREGEGVSPLERRRSHVA